LGCYLSLSERINSSQCTIDTVDDVPLVAKFLWVIDDSVKESPSKVPPLARNLNTIIDNKTSYFHPITGAHELSLLFIQTKTPTLNKSPNLSEKINLDPHC